MKKKIIESTKLGNLYFEETVEESDFGKYYEEYSRDCTIKNNPEVGDIITCGFVLHDKANIILSSPNYKTDILIPIKQEEVDIIQNYSYDSEIEVYITKVVDNRKELSVYGSVYMVKQIQDNAYIYNEFVDRYNNNKSVTGIPVRYNMYGYDVIVNIDESETTVHMPHLLTDMNKLPDPESIIGEEITFFVKKPDDSDGFIASRKDYLKTLAKQELKEIIIGNIYVGFVTGTTKNAVFVQVGNLTGMIHSSNLSPEAKDMLRENKIEPGMQIEVYVKSISRGRLNLTQIWEESLWDVVEVGDLLTGEINEIKQFSQYDFGVLVKLDYETRGMIHSSNLTGEIDDYIVGDTIKVLVKSISIDKRQITLVPA